MLIYVYELIYSCVGKKSMAVRLASIQNTFSGCKLPNIALKLEIRLNKFKIFMSYQRDISFTIPLNLLEVKKCNQIFLKFHVNLHFAGE